MDNKDNNPINVSVYKPYHSNTLSYERNLCKGLLKKVKNKPKNKKSSIWGIMEEKFNVTYERWFVLTHTKLSLEIYKDKYLKDKCSIMHYDDIISCKEVKEEN